MFCVSMCAQAHDTITCRIGQNVPEKSLVADTVPVEGHEPALQDEHDYSTVDDVQHLVIADNPAYRFVPKHDQKPMKEEDQVYSNIDISQQGKVLTSGKLAGYAGSAPGVAASDK